MGAGGLQEPVDGVAVGSDVGLLDEAHGAHEGAAVGGQRLENGFGVGRGFLGGVVEDDVGEVRLVGDDVGRTGEAGVRGGCGGSSTTGGSRGAASGAFGVLVSAAGAVCSGALVAESVSSAPGAVSAGAALSAFGAVLRVLRAVVMVGSLSG